MWHGSILDNNRKVPGWSRRSRFFDQSGIKKVLYFAFLDSCVCLGHIICIDED